MFEDELSDKGMERNVDLKMVLPNKVSFKHLIFYWSNHYKMRTNNGSN